MRSLLRGFLCRAIHRIRNNRIQLWGAKGVDDEEEYDDGGDYADNDDVVESVFIKPHGGITSVPTWCALLLSLVCSCVRRWIYVAGWEVIGLYPGRGFSGVMRKVPRLTVDGIVRRDDEVLLVQRAFDPFKGRWALPGGFVEYRQDRRGGGLPGGPGGDRPAGAAVRPSRGVF